MLSVKIIMQYELQIKDQSFKKVYGCSYNSSIKISFKFFYSIYLCTCLCAILWWCVHGGQRTTFSRWSFPSTGQVWILNSGCQALWQVLYSLIHFTKQKHITSVKNFYFLSISHLYANILANILYPNLEIWCQVEDTTFHRRTNLLANDGMIPIPLFHTCIY